MTAEKAKSQTLITSPEVLCVRPYVFLRPPHFPKSCNIPLKVPTTPPPKSPLPIRRLFKPHPPGCSLSSHFMRLLCTVHVITLYDFLLLICHHFISAESVIKTSAGKFWLSPQIVDSYYMGSQQAYMGSMEGKTVTPGCMTHSPPGVTRSLRSTWEPFPSLHRMAFQTAQ